MHMSKAQLKSLFCVLAGSILGITILKSVYMSKMPLTVTTGDKKIVTY